MVIKNPANALFVVVKGQKGMIFPLFAKDLAALQHVGVLHAVYGFTRPDSVCIIGVGITVKGFKLSSFFPCQGVAEVLGRVALSFTIFIKVMMR